MILVQSSLGVQNQISSTSYSPSAVGVLQDPVRLEPLHRVQQATENEQETIKSTSLDDAHPITSIEKEK